MNVGVRNCNNKNKEKHLEVLNKKLISRTLSIARITLFCNFVRTGWILSS